MRVLVDASYARRGLSGTGVYTERLAAALRALGVDVVEAAPAWPHRYLNLPAEWRWTHLALPRRARRARAQVLHHALPALSARAPCPQVVTVHDLAFIRLPECFDARFRAVAQVRHRAAARGAAAVIVPSEATAADVRSRWAVPAERIVVAPHGPGQAPKHDRGAARHFLYVGDAEPRKNLLRLLAAYERYREQTGPEPLDLVLAGAAAPARAAAPPTGAAPPTTATPVSGIRFEQKPSAERLAELHRHAAALVVPSLHEGFGLTALEAMHAGTPVLAARTAGLAEVCADAARFVDPRDVESIATGLVELATVPPLREELRRRGLQRAANFSWERSARAHMAAYELAIRSTRA